MKETDPNIDSEKSALRVNPGIEQPASINNDALRKYKSRKKSVMNADDFVDGVLSGNRVVLSRAITLVESALDAHYRLAQQVIEKCLPHSGQSLRIGITGVPGVGKSSFIETLGLYLTSIGHRVAVLAIDPSSEISKGSILGDKTRMEKLSADPNAFIRPSPSAGTLGGVTRKTRETIILCEAAGFDIILIETVGVGQSETAVHSMVDFFLLLMLAGAGDELQGIKRGIIEMCDGMAINKADGDNMHRATMAQAQLQCALNLFPVHQSGWKPKVELCSALHNTGIEKVWQMVKYHSDTMKNSGFFELKRAKQLSYRMLDTINQALISRFYQNPKIIEMLPKVEQLLNNHQITAYQAAESLLSLYFEKEKSRKAD
ncbi:MAG TPA: methylmalonyl Co-A mutase-associated GTPase MeaB [Bacteroidales bacterium]|nr:methylmalonyl Co-A mutase-associated GTPase MeaB [Bacteroidales bacterium]